MNMLLCMRIIVTFGVDPVWNHRMKRQNFRHIRFIDASSIRVRIVTLFRNIDGRCRRCRRCRRRCRRARRPKLTSLSFFFVRDTSYSAARSRGRWPTKIASETGDTIPHSPTHATKIGSTQSPRKIHVSTGATPFSSEIYKLRRDTSKWYTRCRGET